MNNDTAFSPIGTYPVRIGNILLYCEHFKAVGGRDFTDGNTIGGKLFCSGNNRKSLRITLEGRIYDSYIPLKALIYGCGQMNSESLFTFSYRGTLFKNCRICAVSAEDKGESFTYASITLITSELPEMESD